VHSASSAIALGDLTGDGELDLVVAHFDTNSISVLPSLGGGAFGPFVSYPAGVNPYALAVADLTGDGLADVAVADFKGTTTVLSNLGAGVLGQLGSVSTGTKTDAIAIADVDGDGRLDLAVAASNSNAVTILPGQLNAMPGPATMYGTGGAHPFGLATADMDGDGTPDLVAANAILDTVSVMLNRSGSAGSPWTFLGGGLAGVHGVPLLTGTGPLYLDTAGAISLTGAAHSAATWLVFGLASNPTPFKCGTLIPFPFALTLPAATSVNGSLLLPWVSWPPGLTGISIWFQCAVHDTAAPCGVSLSTALRADVP
jgi:hypothetical protein